MYMSFDFPEIVVLIFFRYILIQLVTRIRDLSARVSVHHNCQVISSSKF